MPSEKVLVVLSGCHSIAIRKKDGQKVEQETGYVKLIITITNHTTNQPFPTSRYFLKELAQPLQALLDNNYHVTFVTPGGKEPKMDPLSDSSLWFLGTAQFLSSYVSVSTYQPLRQLLRAQPRKRTHQASRPRN